MSYCMTREELYKFIENPYEFMHNVEYYSENDVSWSSRESICIFDYGDGCFLYAEPSSHGNKYVYLTTVHRDTKPINGSGRTVHVELDEVGEMIEKIIEEKEPEGLYGWHEMKELSNDAIASFYS